MVVERNTPVPLLDRLRPPLHVVAYEARMISEPRPALIQRIAARA